MMTKQEAYRILSQIQGDVGWIANVFFTRRGRWSAPNLHALLKLVQKGRQVSCVPYTMPYDKVCVDGKDVSPEEMRNIAKEIE